VRRIVAATPERRCSERRIPAIEGREPDPSLRHHKRELPAEELGDIDFDRATTRDGTIDARADLFRRSASSFSS
jgi:hypothetical protein